MKKLSEIISNAKRKFSIFEKDFNPGSMGSVKKSNDIVKNIDATLDNFCTYAEKSNEICVVYDTREYFDVKNILFKFNDIECEINVDEEAGTITFSANPYVEDFTETEDNVVEYCSAKNEPLCAGTFIYSEYDSTQYCLTLSCAERPLTCEELKWGCNAVYERMSACREDLVDIAYGSVPRSVLRRNAHNSEKFTSVNIRPNIKTRQNIKCAEAMVKSFSENLPPEYTGMKKIKGKTARGELLCTDVCINSKSYEESVYIHDQMLTVVCTSDIDAERVLRYERLRLCLKENCTHKIYEAKFDDNFKLCVCVHLPLCSFVPTEEDFRQFLVKFHNYVGSFVPKFAAWVPKATDIQDEGNDYDDIQMYDKDIDVLLPNHLNFAKDIYSDEDVNFDTIFHIFTEKVTEGEKSYAHPPVLTDDAPDAYRSDF